MEQNKKSRAVKSAMITLVALWAVVALFCCSLGGPSAQRLMSRVRGFTLYVVSAVFGKLSTGVESWISSATPVLIQIVCYALLAGFLWKLFYHIRRVGPRARYGLSMAVTVLVAVMIELSQVFVPDRLPRVQDCLWNLLASAVTLGLIALWRFCWHRFPKWFNAETVSYVGFGALTTLVNIVGYNLTVKALPFHEDAANLVANAVAWVLSVIFAYVVNKLFVFHSKTSSTKLLIRECFMFIAARFVSFLFDEAGMFLLFSVLHISGGISKILVNVIVVILNYFFSKYIIFNWDRKDKNAHPVPDGPDKPREIRQNR